MVIPRVLLLLAFFATNLSCSLSLLVTTNNVVRGRRRYVVVTNNNPNRFINPGVLDDNVRQNRHYIASIASREKHTRSSSCRPQAHQLFASSSLSSSSSSTEGASSSSSSSNNNNNNNNTVQKSLLATSILILLDVSFRSYFIKHSIPFPSSLAGCGSLYIVMMLLNVLSANSRMNNNNNRAGMGERLYQLLNPGANLLATWLPVFFIPSLITLPLAATNLGSTVTEFVKVASVLVGGFLFTLLTTAWSVLGVRKVRKPVGITTHSSIGAEESSFNSIDENDKISSSSNDITAINNKSVPIVEGVLNSVITGIIDTGRQPTPKTFSKTLFRTLKLLTYISGIATVTLMKHATPTNKYIHPVRSAFLLFTTLSTFVFGSNLPKSFTKIVHPLVTCTGLTWLVAQLLSYFSSSTTFVDVIRIYKCGSLSFLHAGPGDILLFLLGPAVIALACQMYSRRQLMQSNIIEVVTSTLISSFGGLYGTALFVRLLHICNPTIRLALLSRNITSPLAMSIAAILGTDSSLAVTMVVLTGLVGANFGSAILNFVNIHDPVARGLGMGAAAHGLGTAAIKDEGDAFPFAAISMALTATTCTCLVSVPMVRQSICKLALGI